MNRCITQIDDLVEKFRTICFNRTTRYPFAFAELQKRISFELRKGIGADQRQLLITLMSVLQQQNVVEDALPIISKYGALYPHSLEVLLQ